MKYNTYYRVNSVKEALSVLANEDRTSICLAGGTNILVKSRTKDWYENMDLVDISGLQELKKIDEFEDRIEIGALVSAGEIINSKLCFKYAELLVKACKEIGGPQIRNRATIGGNVANACPAADMIPALTAQKAKVRLLNKSERIEIPIEDFIIERIACLGHDEMTVRTCFYGNPAGKKTMLQQGQMITAIVIPKLYGNYQTTFQKVGRRETMVMSKFTLAILLKKNNEMIEDLRVVIGAALAKTELQTELVAPLIGKNPSDEELQKFADQLSDKIKTQGKNTEIMQYKAIVCKRLCARTLKEMIRGDNDEYKD